MSDYMVKMGANPETLEDHCHKTMSNMMTVIKYLMKGENERAKMWMEDLLLPGFDEVSKLQDSKYGTNWSVMLYREGNFDWDLICSSGL